MQTINIYHTSCLFQASYLIAGRHFPAWVLLTDIQNLCKFTTSVDIFQQNIYLSSHSDSTCTLDRSLQLFPYYTLLQYVPTFLISSVQNTKHVNQQIKPTLSYTTEVRHTVRETRGSSSHLSKVSSRFTVR